MAKVRLLLTLSKTDYFVLAFVHLCGGFALGSWASSCSVDRARAESVGLEDRLVNCEVRSADVDECFRLSTDALLGWHGCILERDREMGPALDEAPRACSCWDPPP